MEVKSAETIAELEAALGTEVEWLEMSDRLAAQRVVRIATQLRLMDEYLDRLGGGLIDAKGRARGCAQLYLQLDRRFESWCDRLGLTPAARLAIRSTAASGARDGLAAQLAKRRLEREASA